VGNLALTTIFILVLAVPGYVALNTYHSKGMLRAVLPRDIPGDLAKAFLVSLPLHWFCIVVVELLHHGFVVVPDINFKIVGRLITGNYSPESKLFSSDIDNLYQHSLFIIGYVFFLLAVSFLTGLIARDLVWNRKLDLKFPNLFGFRNKWLYLLTGREFMEENPSVGEVIPMVDALASVGGKTRLYRGVVEDFATDQTGALQEIYLIQALRGKFREVAQGPAEFYWEEIPGDLFVLKYSEVLNLNITYLPVPS